MSTPTQVPYYRPRPRSIVGPLVLITIGIVFLLQFGHGNPALAHIIAGHGAGKDVGGGGDLHRLPAQALATIWFICWIAGGRGAMPFQQIEDIGDPAGGTGGAGY